jgi:hypothetical protein
MRNYAQRLTIGATVIVLVYAVVGKIGENWAERILTSPLYMCLVSKLPLKEEWFGPSPGCPNDRPTLSPKEVPERHPSNGDGSRGGSSKSDGDTTSGEAFPHGRREPDYRSGPPTGAGGTGDRGLGRSEDLRRGVDRLGRWYRYWRYCYGPPGTIRYCDKWQYGPVPDD